MGRDHGQTTTLVDQTGSIARSSSALRIETEEAQRAGSGAQMATRGMPGAWSTGNRYTAAEFIRSRPAADPCSTASQSRWYSGLLARPSTPTKATTSPWMPVSPRSMRSRIVAKKLVHSREPGCSLVTHRYRLWCGSVAATVKMPRVPFASMGGPLCVVP